MSHKMYTGFMISHTLLHIFVKAFIINMSLKTRLSSVKHNLNLLLVKIEPSPVKNGRTDTRVNGKVL